MASRAGPRARSVAYRSGRHPRPIYGTKSKFRRIVAERGLVGLANDTKWDELLTAMRTIESGLWRPANRVKLVHAAPLAEGWDAEWWHHLPFPMISIEWMDIACRERRRNSQRPTTTDEIDHTARLATVLERIGFDILAGRHMIRIFAYSPRDLTLFDERE